MTELKVQSAKPFIEIDGTHYTIGHKEAMMAEMLIEHIGETMPFERLIARLETTAGAVQVMAHKLRKIFENHHYVLRSTFEEGYVLRYNRVDPVDRRAA